jgi:autotransporter-associated beta strand protein
MSLSKYCYLLAALTAICASQFAVSSPAATITWTGTTNNNWSLDGGDVDWFDGANNVAYTANSDVVFTDNFGSNPTISPLSASLNPTSMTFSHIAGSTPTTYTFDRTTTGAPFGATANTALLLDTGFLGQVNLLQRSAATSNGSTTIKSGTLELHDAAAFPGNGTDFNHSPVTLAGGTLSIKVDTNGQTMPASTNLLGTLTVTDNSTLQNNAINTSRIWNGSLNVAAGKTLTINPNASNTAGVVAFLGATLSGATDLGTISLGANSGTLELQGVNTQSTTATFDLGTAGGVIRNNRPTTTLNLGALTGGTGGGQLQGSSASNGSTTYSIGAANVANALFQGKITDGTGVPTVGVTNIIKTGSGIENFAGANTYSGTTTISAGTLLVTGTHTGAGSTAAGAYSVNGTGVLGGDGSIKTTGATVSAGGKLSPGVLLGTLKMNLGSGALDISGAVAANGSASMVFDLDTPGTSDEVLLTNANSSLSIGSGTLAFNDFAFSPTANFAPGTYTLFGTGKTITGALDANAGNLSGAIGAYTGTLSLSANGQNVLLTVAPEPGAVVLLSLGGLGLLPFRRRR